MTKHTNYERNQEIEKGTKETPKPGKPSLMTRLVNLAKNSMKLWQSPDRQPFASLKFKDTGIHHLPLLGTEFKYVLMEAASTALGQIPNSRAVKEAIEGLSFCFYKIEMLPLHEMPKMYDNQDQNLIRPNEGQWVRIK